MRGRAVDLHEEITADYNDMIYAATRAEVEARHKVFIRKWRVDQQRTCPNCGADETGHGSE